MGGMSDPLDMAVDLGAVPPALPLMETWGELSRNRTPAPPPHHQGLIPGVIPFLGCASGRPCARQESRGQDHDLDRCTSFSLH